MNFSLTTLFIILSLTLTNTAVFSQGQSGQIPRNIVLMIGDGMGVGQVTAGRTYKGSLALDKFKTLGLLLTHAYGEQYVTDSAAAATALASGIKTYNGAVGVDVDTVANETILERAEKVGKKTGIVVTCSITHATPACFVSHVANRGMYFEIAEQISRSKTDLYLGGGWGWFLPIGKGGWRKNDENLIEKMQSDGFTFVATDSAFRLLSLKKTKRILGLFAENNDWGYAQVRKPSLREMTAASLQFLNSSGNGFFLMVEGSQIDWAGHNNMSEQIMVEMADFDDAIAEVVNFAEKNPETLVIVTADHETGGYAHNGGSLREKTIEGAFTTTHHTATMIPLFAMGPGAEHFAGIQENSNVGKMLLELWQ